MNKYINTWKSSKESVIRQSNHFLVDTETREPTNESATPIHNHIFTEIEFIAAGHCVQNINGHEIACAAGMLFLMFPQDVHQYVKFNERTELYSLCFADDMLPREVLDILYTKNGVLAVQLNEKDSRNIQNRFQKLIWENKEQQLGSNLLIRSFILEIVLEILRKAKIIKFSIQNPALRQALRYIRENFKQPISLTGLAKTVHLTPQYFCKLFKAELNLSFHEYLRNMRLDYAMMLLTTGTMSVTDICLESGFNSASNFTKIFKERFGVSPKNVRKK